MTKTFPSRWPPRHPDRLQLYSQATPNGLKITVALEVLGLPYDLHVIDIMAGDQFDEEYVELVNPNSKIPAIIDPNGPGGEPLNLIESGAILLYLADKTGKLLPTDPRRRWDALQWLFFQTSNLAPFLGQFGHFFKFARDKTSDDYGVERYTNEARRLLGVLNRRLEGRPFLAGDELTVVDIAAFPWVQALDFYEGKEQVGYDSFANVEPWVQRCLAQPGVRRGLDVFNE